MRFTDEEQKNIEILNGIFYWSLSIIGLIVIGTAIYGILYSLGVIK
jgi:hypothetical protein